MSDQERGQSGAGQRAAGPLRRRGLLAGAAALLGAGLAKLAAPEQAKAVGGGDGQALIVGDVNTDNQNKQTTLHSNAVYGFASLGDSSQTTAIYAQGGTGTTSSGGGVYGLGGNVGGGVAGGTGVVGEGAHGGTGGTGVFGLGGLPGGSFIRGGIGVLGQSDTNIGVNGVSSSSIGVQGTSTSNAGVVGSSNTGVGCQGSSNGNVGVLGTSNTSVGVYANSLQQYGLYATSPNNYAAIGTSNSGTGVYGSSTSNVGVLGTSSSSIGVFGSSSSGTGVYGTGPANGFAARFDGPVQVNGAFTVLGGPKSAAVPHPDGSYRRLYCVESPESWFEDFGRGQLANGQATIRLDRDFAALVRGDQYDVFLTLKGDCNGLYVSGQSPASFEVRELKGGTSNVAFSYRVVAKRKDIAGPRLEKVDVAAAQERPAAPAAAPAIPPVPAPPAPPEVPKPPETPRGRP
ncbi:MAG TPA: hypothetical protein VK066_23555 [Chloroflexota bacterium]|nr:hypothetical protein [Chloroflexota bacterium]